MIETLAFFTSGVLLGLVSGMIPGPLLTVVIAETLKHNRREGIIVASAPVLTDIPIVLSSIFILAKLSSVHAIMGAISMIGALYIGYLAYGSIALKGRTEHLQDVKAQSLRKGMITNILSPHPYLFWMAIGAPTVLKAYTVNLTSALLFVFGFYLLLVGSKVVVAVMVDRSKAFLKSNTYLYIIRGLGFILLLFAALFIRDGLRFFGII